LARFGFWRREAGTGAAGRILPTAAGRILPGNCAKEFRCFRIKPGDGPSVLTVESAGAGGTRGLGGGFGVIGADGGFVRGRIDRDAAFTLAGAGRGIRLLWERVRK